MKNEWHSLSLSEIEKALNTDIINGLSIRESRDRLEKEKKRDGGDRRSLFIPSKCLYLHHIFTFFATPGVIILIIISLLAAIFGSIYSGLAVLLITVIGALTGGFVLHSAQRRIDAMNEYASPMSRVMRGGNYFYTDGRNIVRGDIIILSKGDLLPCDARLISSDSLTVKELINTKKGVRNRIIEKSHETEYNNNDGTKTPDALNMLYAGSAVISGHAVAVAVRTGKDVYLAKYMPDGGLSGIENIDEGINAFKPVLQRITFIAISALAILSLLSLVTLKETSFVSNFLMLLSSVAMISLETLKMGQRNIFASRMEKLSRRVNLKKKKDAAAHIRGVKTFETLTKVTDLVLLGRAAFSDGVYHVGGLCSYTGSESSVPLSPDNPSSNRTLTYMYTYLKALRESKTENDFVLDGTADALWDYIRTSGFDASGASLVIKSLYFADDTEGENGYACAETSECTYRTALTFDSNILDFCKYVRAEDAQGKKDISSAEHSISKFRENTESRGGRCLYAVSETDGQTVLEGIISLYENPAEELKSALPELERLGIRITAMLSDSEYSRIKGMALPLLDGKTAYASEFKKNGLDITDKISEYSAYIGFSAEEYAALISAMRRRGACVAAYGIDDGYYDAMSRADISVSADVLIYSSQKYRESVYERLAHSGRDSNIRCSQRTRVKSKVLIHRSHAKGGGLSALANAVRKARGAYISFAQSILLFTSLMCMLICTVSMSAIVGIQLLNSVQTASLSLIGAILSMLVFADSEPRYELLYSRTDFPKYSAKLIDGRLVSFVAKAAFTVLFAVTLKILDVSGVFGENASYTMPIFLSMLFVAAAEMFMINNEFTRRGEGRRRSWFAFLTAYALILSVGGIITQGGFAEELFKDGMGTLEFIITPVFCALYLALTVSLYLISRRSHKVNKK